MKAAIWAHPPGITPGPVPPPAEDCVSILIRADDPGHGSVREVAPNGVASATQVEGTAILARWRPPHGVPPSVLGAEPLPLRGDAAGERQQGAGNGDKEDARTGNSFPHGEALPAVKAAYCARELGHGTGPPSTLGGGFHLSRCRAPSEMLSV